MRDLQGILLGADNGKQPWLHSYSGFDGNVQRGHMARGHHDLPRFCWQHLLSGVSAPQSLDLFPFSPSKVDDARVTAVSLGSPSALLYVAFPESPNVDSVWHRVPLKLH